MFTANIKQQPSSIWWFFLLQGIAGIILGLMLLTDTADTFVAMVSFVGFYWVITGWLSMVRALVDRSVPALWSLLIGIVGILAGVFVMKHPLVAALTVPTVLVIIFGVQGLAMGALEIVGGFTGGGIGSFILGVVNMLVGLVLLSSPLTAALAVPVLFGLFLLVQGVALVSLALRVRALRPPPPQLSLQGNT